MLNQKAAEILEEIADMEEMDGKRWEAIAYRKAAQSIMSLGKDIVDIYKEGKLGEIEGVGSAIEKKLIQLIETGNIDKYEELRKKFPIDFVNLRKIQGLGPKKIALLYTKLGVKNIEDLNEAIKNHRVAGLEGFGSKSEQNLLRAIEVYQKFGSGRFFLARVYDDIYDLKKSIENSGIFSFVEIVGSFRRMRETVGDVDILAVSESHDSGYSFFSKLPQIDSIINMGSAKVTARLKSGLNCDFRIFKSDEIGSALQYFTGSKDHNVKLRNLAISKGLKLNEYGLFKGENKIAGDDEVEVYRGLGLSWIPPEMRENMGEIEAAERGEIPEIIGYDQVQGDLHTHTSETDGKNTLEEMVEAAEKNGLKYIAVTNHSKSLRVAKGMDEAAFRKFNRRIDELQDSHSLKILKGVEMDILRNGELDLGAELLEEMNIVLASLHQWASSSLTENTDRLLKAIYSGHISVIAHPTGRLIGSREQIPLDFPKLFDACKEMNVALEINGYPERSDLPYDIVHEARSYGVKFSLGSDAHSLSDLNFLKFSAAIARRGWLRKCDVLNTLSAESLIKELKR